MDTVLTSDLVALAKKRSQHFNVEGFVYGQGPVKPKFLLIGEAPGETEALNGIPFSGRAGKELMRFFELLEVDRKEVYITSAFRSRPYRYKEKIDRKTKQVVLRKYNRPPTKQELVAHAPLLDQEVEKVQAPYILTMGNIGLQRLIGPTAKVSTQHGQLYKGPVLRLVSLKDNTYIWTEKDYAVFSTFHPAAIFYNRQLLETIHEDLAEFKKLIHKI
ncbi:uracil-DNA glycosylase [Carnobacterium jeotgali]|uniref:uracil-DNA glycosylase n=1 Tax=Carnobacterium jeotgali TaxID=545534 RepID=UPI00388D7562